MANNVRGRYKDKDRENNSLEIVVLWVLLSISCIDRLNCAKQMYLLFRCPQLLLPLVSLGKTYLKKFCQRCGVS